MKDRKAEACRRSADEVRKIASGAGTVHERDAFQRLADGYDLLAEQLEQIAVRRGTTRDDGRRLLNRAHLTPRSMLVGSGQV
jgi:hypothetical protein